MSRLSLKVNFMMRGLVPFIVTLCLLFAQVVGAQPAPDYEAWNNIATGVEERLKAGEGSDAFLRELRTIVVGWREQFSAAQDVNSARISTLGEQIAGLGAAPAEGETEVAEIAARRSELTDQLAQLEAPRLTAQEAFNRADGIISELDQTLRDRQTDELLKLGPTPAQPTRWPAAFQALKGSVSELTSGIKVAFAARNASETPLPLIFILLGVGGLLIVRSRRIVERVAIRVESQETDASSGFTGFIVSLGQVLLPLLGFLALATAFNLTGFYGPRGEAVSALLPTIGLIYFTVRWLAARLFPASSAIETPLDVPEGLNKSARSWAGIVGLVYITSLVLDTFEQLDGWSPATSAVLDFPLIGLAGLALFWLGRALSKAERDGLEPGETLQRIRLARLAGRAVSVVGAVGPVLALVGYHALAELLVFGMAITLTIFGGVLVLQEAVRDFAAWVSRDGVSGRDRLWPVLVNFLLVLCTLPLLALIWGAKWTDLQEIWTTFQDGISLGDTRISPMAFVTLIVVFTIGLMLTRLFQATMKTSILPRTKMDPGGQTALVSGLGYIGIFIAALIAISSAGLDLSNLAIVAGALSVGIGFGLQNIVSNFVSGIILLIERPIAEGDWIEVGGHMGTVRDISVRSTRIETFDRTDVIVPNADLVSGAVTNYTRGNSVGRVILPIGVAYGTDTRRVEAILREIIEAQPMVSLSPPPSVLFMGFGADSLDFEVRAILRDINFGLTVRNDVNHAIAQRFTEEGIEMPFAQRDIWLRNPEVLTQSGT